MLSIIEAAGWPIWPLIICSVVSVAIIADRLWSLREAKVMPKELVLNAARECEQSGVSQMMIQRWEQTAPLGRLLAAAARNIKCESQIAKEAIEEAARKEALHLERFLTTLGTISAMAPLLGLLGTVIGMIEIFGSQTSQGSNPLALAQGISIALYNTAFGLIVAIPSMAFYRYFRSRVDILLVDMEMQALKLVEIANGERRA